MLSVHSSNRKLTNQNLLSPVQCIPWMISSLKGIFQEIDRTKQLSCHNYCTTFSELLILKTSMRLYLDCRPITPVLLYVLTATQSARMLEYFFIPLLSKLRVEGHCHTSVFCLSLKFHCRFDLH